MFSLRPDQVGRGKRPWMAPADQKGTPMNTILADSVEVGSGGLFGLLIVVLVIFLIVYLVRRI